MAKKKKKSKSKSKDKKGKSKSKKRKSAKRDIDFGEAKKKQKELEERGSGDYHELKEGWNYFYICPPWDAAIKVLWKEVQQHGLGLVCPKHSGYDKDCLICKERKKALKKGDTDFADNFRLASRGFLNAIRKEHIKKKGPVKVLGIPGGVFEQIVDHVTDERVNISDPEAAIIVGIKRKGKGFRTKYPSVKFSEPIDISKWITSAIFEELTDLDTLRGAQPATTKAQRTAIRKFVKGDADEDDDADDFEDDDLSSDEEGEEFEGESEEDELFDEPEDDEDELDEDEEDEDEDEEEDEEDEEEDEDELFDEDEEEEDELEEDEEEDEPPPKKKKQKAKSKKKKGKSKSGKVGKKAKKASKGKGKKKRK